jgi:hypothetical protein
MLVNAGTRRAPNAAHWQQRRHRRRPRDRLNPEMDLLTQIDA